MGKSRAEIQRAYRERQKEKGPTFLQLERMRVRKYYVPAKDLSQKNLKERNENAKLRNRLSRLRKKEREEDITADESSSGYGSMEQVTPLIVKLPAFSKKKVTNVTSSQKAKGLKKTRGRALSRARKRIQTLQNDVDSLRKKLRVKNTQMHRLKNKFTNIEVKKRKQSTPMKQTERDMEDLQLTPKRQTIARKKLLLSNAIMSEIGDTKKTVSKKKRRPLHSILSGRITKKYRLLTALSRSTGLSRHSLRKTTTKSLHTPSEKRKSLTKELEATVIDFLEREDNCRVQPGKSDAKKDETGQKKQTMVLTDYMKNLHIKFLAENPQIKISLASFCRLRPKHILLAAFISRNTCQCIRHQNMALKMQSLKKAGVPVNSNPESILEQLNEIDTLLENLPDTVVLKVWKRVPLENGIQKMKIVEENVEKTVFKEFFRKEADEFCSHVARVRDQYRELRKLKENLKEHEIILQMDFAENFSCRSLDEVQTAYWNQTSVTLHPVVAYYKQNGTLNHKSSVVVSDESSHSATTVCAFIDALVPHLKDIDKDVQYIHYWTDSPSSQYRNRFIFHVLSTHVTTYGMKATWNYFEAGHGKGPCDGLGGTTKRMADEAIRQGNAVIQDSVEFFKWAEQSSMKEVTFIYVTKATCEEKKLAMSEMSIKPVKNTMKLHAVVGKGNGILLTRETSCYCDNCIEGNFCDTWHAVVVDQNVSAEASRKPSAENTSMSVEKTNTALQTCEGNFVAAVYNKNWYIGKITMIDNDEDEVEVTFMEKAKQFYKWPCHEDKIWIKRDDILCAISSLTPTGKSCRLFKLEETTETQIAELFISH